jgi:hypothetical protein
MKKEILSAANGAPLTRNQGSTLYKFTGLKFWEPESLPVPTVAQASILIGGLISYNKKETTFEHKDYKTQETAVLSNADILDCIQLWFPNIEDMKEARPRFFKKKAQPHHEETEHEPEEEEEETTPAPPPSKSLPRPTAPSPSRKEPEPMPKPVPEPRSNRGKPVPERSRRAVPEPVEGDTGQSTILKLILAGLRNLWMVGPAGSGKTTLGQLSGDHLEWPVTVIPCGAGTSATTFLGYKYPDREGTPFVHAFSQQGIIILDEFTALEAQVAQIVNGALANNELSATTGTVKRHPDCVIIATSNTFGNGGDRQYVANNQLDASTIDRFAGGMIEIDYSKEYESRFNSDVCKYVWHMRDVINKNGLRKIASTRGIINASLLKEAGLNWKESLTVNWSKDEKALL